MSQVKLVVSMLVFYTFCEKGSEGSEGSNGPQMR